MVDETIIERIQKLLNLAAKNPNEHEAAAAAAKAQRLLIEHNLDQSTVEAKAGEGGRRAQEEVEGGFYRYQRDLWAAMARLNFCTHWVQVYRVPESLRASLRNVRHRRRHMLVGRTSNVRATVVLSGYLLQAIERVTKERCEKGKIGHLSGWAMSFREGCSYRIVQELEDRRQAQITEEEKRIREASERAGTSTSTALTISTMEKAEADANHDFIHGEGASAKRNARRAEAAREARERQEAHTRWAAENPEEAKKEEEKRKKAHERWERSASNQRFGKVDDGAFWAGYDEAKGIGLDQQAEGTKVSGRLT